MTSGSNVDSGLISTQRMSGGRTAEDNEEIACNITNLAGVLQNFVDRYGMIYVASVTKYKHLD